MSYRIQFLRDASGQPVGCLAVKTESEFTATKVRSQTTTITYQLSALNPLDKFDRAFARQIALGRIVESPFVLKVKTAKTMHEISKAVMKDLSCNKKAPARTRRAAKALAQG